MRQEGIKTTLCSFHSYHKWKIHRGKKKDENSFLLFKQYLENREAAHLHGRYEKTDKS